MAKLQWQAEAADFDYPEHEPEWIEAGRALVCTVCGAVVTNPALSGRVLPTGVVFRGGPALDADAEDLYRQEKQS